VAQALYEPAPSANQLSALGLRVTDLDSDVEVFPDVWPALVLMMSMSTQWRVGMGGPIGLDYGVVREVGSIIGLSKKQVSKAFPDLQVMEAEALTVMAESRPQSP
jgi:hypothetical protein